MGQLLVHLSIIASSCSFQLSSSHLPSNAASTASPSSGNACTRIAYSGIASSTCSVTGGSGAEVAGAGAGGITNPGTVAESAAAAAVAAAAVAARVTGASFWSQRRRGFLTVSRLWSGRSRPKEGKGGKGKGAMRRENVYILPKETRKRTSS